TLRLHRLQAILAEVERIAGGRDAVNTALEGLAVFGALRLQHDSYPLARGHFAPRTAGIGLVHLLVLRHRVVLEDLTLEDPDLDPAGAVGGEGGRHTVIDIGAQRVQRY